MKTLPTFIFTCIITAILLSCAKEAATFPQLDPSPLSQSYKNNKVYSYTRTVYFNDSIVDKDSVTINPNGYTTDVLSINGQYEKTHYEYDSLNRVVAKQYNGDTNYTNSVKGYGINQKTHMVWQQWQAFNTCYKFDSDFKILRQAVTTNGTTTLHVTNYKYKNNRLVLITNIPAEEPPTKILYTYKASTLATISTGNELQYISAQTGLIDSVKTPYPNEHIYYKYYKH